jgi:PII-like signaling protein
VEERIKSFLPVVDELFEKTGCGGMVTIEKAEIIKYTPGK